jgi:hypothetical protein
MTAFWQMRRGGPSRRPTTSYRGLLWAPSINEGLNILTAVEGTIQPLPNIPVQVYFAHGFTHETARMDWQ